MAENSLHDISSISQIFSTWVLQGEELDYTPLISAAWSQSDKDAFIPFFKVRDTPQQAEAVGVCSEGCKSITMENTRIGWCLYATDFRK